MTLLPLFNSSTPKLSSNHKHIPMAPNPPPPPPPTSKLSRTTSVGTGTILLDKYQLGRLLGRGSFAKVYHARSLQTSAEVAIKVIEKTINPATGASIEPRIIREVSAMRRLQNHPNILKLHEVMATKSKIYLVMELAPGGELLDKLKKSRKFSENTARKYFQQVVSALCFCHENGIVHRDIKPQNLLLDQKGVLKITDFGLSALSEHKRDDGLIHTACGTPAYTAPEVVYRNGYDGEKADAWSCGVLLYFFLVGKLPFDDSNLSNMYRAMHRRSFDFPDSISKPAKKLIYKLLDPDPNTRLGLNEIVNRSWFKNNKLEKISVGLDFLEQKEVNYKYGVNAFDIISMSSGLDLSGFFDSGLVKRREIMRFTCGVEMVKIEEKVVKVGCDLGYKVSRGKDGGIGLVKEMVVLVVEIWEVAVGLWLVEVRLINNGAVEFGQLHWLDFKTGLGDIVLSGCPQ